MQSYFVTATGTDTGKTFCTAGLLRAARAAGWDLAAIKPVLSGYDPTSPAGSDPAMLLAAMERAVTAETVAQISPFRFFAPLSPDMAAAREGQQIDPTEVTDFCRASIAETPAGLLIEGVGGVAVPLAPEYLVADWIAALGLPAILVAGTYLGTLSHTITAADFLLRRGITIAALLLNDHTQGPVPAAETAASLASYIAAPCHVIPADAGPAAFQPVLQTLWAGRVSPAGPAFRRSTEI
jgi:dethiobiotin synthetase